MRCDKAKELLMTDYFDGIADEETQKAVKEHLSTCASCRETEQALAKARISLQNAPRVEPPVKVWENIQLKILKESLNGKPQPAISLPGWLERLFAPKPIFAAATVMAVVLVAVVLRFTTFHKQLATGDNGEEIVFLYHNGYQEDASTASLGTDIERYFL